MDRARWRRRLEDEAPQGRSSQETPLQPASQAGTVGIMELSVCWISWLLVRRHPRHHPQIVISLVGARKSTGAVVSRPFASLYDERDKSEGGREDFAVNTTTRFPCYERRQGAMLVSRLFPLCRHREASERLDPQSSCIPPVFLNDFRHVIISAQEMF